MKVPDQMAQLNRAVTNRIMGPVARWAPAMGIVQHRGRRSGNRYETPVLVTGAADGRVVIPLPYGTSRDWVQNVLAAGSFTLVTQGSGRDLAEVELVTDADAIPGANPVLRKVGSALDLEGYLVAR